MKHDSTNNLKGQKSPYLQQHADNPVNWFPWGPEAFAKAADENKPVFLSIGYSTCHWCHVMADESFLDTDMAELLNHDFVSVKVDREERPDIDSFYLSACRILTGSAGWPLTVFLTPEKKPFFAGTYFPKESRYGQVGLAEILPRIAYLWRDRRSDLERAGDEIVDLLRAQAGDIEGEEPTEAILNLTFHQLAEQFDSNFGGFGPAPKFPTPHNLTFLLRYMTHTGSEAALSMVEKTLQSIRRGGIYDHVGFGFHRYSTDAEWQSPHFEKMLSDQALLANAYIETYQITGKKEYARTAREIFTYVLRDMTDPAGGFYTAEDADTEGEEGKYYIWSLADMEHGLTPEDLSMARNIFDINEDSDANILHLRKANSEIATDLGTDEPGLNRMIADISGKLLEYRKKRVQPHRDDKVLADWNGLMIAALAKGGRVFHEPRYVDAAAAAAKFIDSKMTYGGGRLWHRYRDGEAAMPGYLDDYAFLIWGLLELYQATHEASYLGRALDLNKILIDHFWDDEGGAFFQTADDDEALFVRRKELYDGAVPAGNSVAAGNLIKLARLTGRPDLEEQAGRILTAFSRAVSDAPAACTQLLQALDLALSPSREVVIVGDPKADDTQQLLEVVNQDFRPGTISLLRDQTEPEIDRYAPFTRDMRANDGRATAYACRDHTCEAPTTDPAELREILGALGRP
jgi:uncharacterized protein YyaL (SSP411 family)